MGSEVLSASPLAAAQTGTSYTHIAFNFALQHCYYIFDSFFKEAIFLLVLLLLIPYFCHISASLCFWEIQRKVEPLRLHFVHHL